MVRSGRRLKGRAEVRADPAAGTAAAAAAAGTAAAAAAARLPRRSATQRAQNTRSRPPAVLWARVDGVRPRGGRGPGWRGAGSEGSPGVSATAIQTRNLRQSEGTGGT